MCGRTAHKDEELRHFLSPDIQVEKQRIKLVSTVELKYHRTFIFLKAQKQSLLSNQTVIMSFLDSN